ncbi:tRNA-guanine transglycosylase family protein [Saccharata proteae CBS 121410]|uniref:Queuine tRNA-ribosyltransferase accessory subunit 2 n=1 Tax=Saccharata proteae CBS 121410 TaxID=1314787 RepID=A0A9P4LVK2_9PEZI|nr:tRNA-guanine transglycosylase family protein [Saccharata proteae CBS 121410]
MKFEMIKSWIPLSPRLGKLTIPGRSTIDTPNYLANTSRGIVPHLTQDMVRSNTNVNSVYTALEDFIERAPQKTPPVFSTPTPSNNSPMRQFIALQDDAVLVLGARRIPPVPCPTSNTDTGISIYTSVGFTTLTSAQYVSAAQKLRPDIVVGLADIPSSPQRSNKRADKMSDRTSTWTKDIITARNSPAKTNPDNTNPPNIFAPIPPLSRELQSHYLDHLADCSSSRHVDGEEADERAAAQTNQLAGLAIYAAASLSDIPATLSHLPRLSLTEASTPAQLLREISQGADLFVIPFIAAATDAGIALSFTFPAPSAPIPTRASPGATTEKASPAKLALGMDMWNPVHATDAAPLDAGCACYACARHHRAYIQHLLVAKEMLVWVLLQTHNHAVLDRFFAAVRESIAAATFAGDEAAFASAYEPELPVKTGLGPRVRGYQYKSDGPGEQTRNRSAYSRNLKDRRGKLEEADAPAENVSAEDLAEKGFAEVKGR